MIAKYLIILRRDEYVPLLWPNLGTLTHTLEHKTVADAIVRAEPTVRIVSAGSCLPCDGWRCFGDSLSLGLRSRGTTDTAIMLEHFALRSTARASTPADSFGETGCPGSVCISDADLVAPTG